MNAWIFFLGGDCEDRYFLQKKKKKDPCSPVDIYLILKGYAYSFFMVK